MPPRGEPAAARLAHGGSRRLAPRAGSRGVGLGGARRLGCLVRLGGEDCEECAHWATLWRAGRASLRGATVGFSPAPPTARDRLTGSRAGSDMADLTSRTDLLEREAELAQIGDALGAAAGGAGGVVVIEGAAGIGKSSLMDATAALAEAGGMVVLRARGGIMEKEFALGVVIQLLAPSVEPLAGPERERLFTGAAGLARPLFEEVPDRAAADDRLFARFHGLHWLCARLAEAVPLALLVDDAHWADEHSLRFLAYLEARIEELPACLIVAVRTGETDALTLLADREPRIALRPAPLSPAAVARLVRGRLGEDMGDAICAECARTTAGNPLLARQLITALGERGVEPASLDPSAIAAMGPPSVARFVSARLRRHSPAVGDVARALAILGDDASLADTAEVAGVDRAATARRRRHADRRRAPATGPAAAVRPPDHPAGARRLDPGGRAGAAAPRRGARTRARSGALRARGGPPAGRRSRRRALGVRRPGGGGPPRRRPRRRRPCGALPAPGAAGGGAGPGTARAPARARRGRGGGAHARGCRAPRGGAAPVERAGGAGAGGARRLDGALPGRRAPGGGRGLRGRCSRPTASSIASSGWRSSSRRPPPASSAGSRTWRRSGGCWRSSRRCAAARPRRSSACSP